MSRQASSSFLFALAAVVALVALLTSSPSPSPFFVSATGGITITESKAPGPSATVTVQKPKGLPEIDFVNFVGPQKPDGGPAAWIPAVAKALQPDKPQLLQNIERVAQGGVNVDKPPKPNLAVSVQPTGTPPPIVIEAPTKIKGNVSITKTTVVDPPSPPAAVNVTSPAFDLNVTVIKEPKQPVKPFYQGAQANISVTKFSKQQATNFSYAKPASNFSITLTKPGSASWARNAQGQWTKQQATKGITLNGSIAPPVSAGPLEEIVGERLVCKFPLGSSQQQLAEPIKVPAGLANAVASSSPYSFVAPPFGLKVFGPGCQVYDWACRSTFQVPCSGHGVCLSTIPSTCECFSGYASCLAPGSSTGCETNTFSDPNNCLGCGTNVTTGERNSNFICPPEKPVCCGRLGCTTLSFCSAQVKTNDTSQQTSTFPNSVTKGLDVTAPSSLSALLEGEDGVQGGIRGDAPSRVAPFGGGGGDDEEGMGSGRSGGGGGGRSAAARPSSRSKPKSKTLQDAVENLLPISVMPGEEVVIPAVPQGMNEAQANAALAAASAREQAIVNARAKNAARGFGGGLAGAGASDQDDDEMVAAANRRAAAAAGRIDEIGGGRGVGTSAVFSG